jgi:hypothetical protein
LVRVSISREEALQAHDLGGSGSADQDRAASAVFDQGDAAQDQRPHDLLANFGLGD